MRSCKAIGTGCHGVRSRCQAARRVHVCRAALWSRQPDDWDAQWEREEQERRLAAQQLQQQQVAMDEAAWRQQVDAAHQQLLDQQKHRAALSSRLQQDTARAKQEQLRRIAPVARARARAYGLATLAQDPDMAALQDRFGRMSGLVEEVQRRLEAEYRLDGAAATAARLLGTQQPQQGQLPPQQWQQQGQLQQWQLGQLQPQQGQQWQPPASQQQQWRGSQAHQQPSLRAPAQQQQQRPAALPDGSLGAAQAFNNQPWPPQQQQQQQLDQWQAPRHPTIVAAVPQQPAPPTMRGEAAMQQALQQQWRQQQQLS